MADNGATVGPKDSRVLYWSMHTKIREHQKARNEPKSKIKTCEKQPFSTNPETADLQNYRRFVCFSESAATAAVRMWLDILCPGGLGVSGGSRRQLSGARSWGVRGGPPDTPDTPDTPGHPRTPRIRDLDRLLPRRDDSRGAKQGRAQQGEADRAASMPTPSRLSPERSASKYGRARDEFGSEVFSVETLKRAPVFHTLRSKIPVSSKSRSQS